MDDLFDFSIEVGAVGSVNALDSLAAQKRFPNIPDCSNEGIPDVDADFFVCEG